MQINSDDQTAKINTVQDSKDFNSQPLATQVKKGEQIASMMPPIKKTFDLMGDDIVESATDNESLKNKIGSYEEKMVRRIKNKTFKTDR